MMCFSTSWEKRQSSIKPGVLLVRWRTLVLFTAALALILLFILLLPDAEAKEIVVDEKGTGNYTTLSGALSDADPGDIILLKEGNYTNRYSGSENITIRGENNETCRILDQGTGFWVSGENLTIDNCNISSTDPGISTQLWFGSNARNCILSNCSIYNFQGGIIVSSSVWDLGFKNNTLWNTSLRVSPQSLEQMYSYHLQGNTINGRPLHYLVNESNRSFSTPAAGFIMVNCTNITLSGVDMSGHGNGIFTFYCSEIVIEDCRGDSWSHFIWVSQSNSVHILNNTLRRPTINGPSVYQGYSMYIWYVSDLLVSGNHISGGGILLGRCGGARIHGNVVEGEIGIVLYYTSTSTVTGNAMIGRGLSIQVDSYFADHDPEYYVHTISDNRLDERPIYYYQDESDITIPTDAGQVLLVNCTNITARKLGTTAATVPFLLYNTTNTHISGYQSTLRLVRSHRNRVMNCSVTGLRGMELMESKDNSIINNNCSGNSYDGIILLDSQGNTLIGNNCSGNGFGGISLRNSNRTRLQGNHLLANQNYGIWITNSHDISITGNNISVNKQGVQVQGICNKITLNYNNIHGNKDFGIEVKDPGNSSVDARHNWWGDPSGPLHMLENPNEKGDIVSDGVDFWSWLKEETDGIPPEEKETDSMRFPGLLFSILGTIIMLLAMVRFPPESLRSLRTHTEEDDQTGSSHDPLEPRSVASCPHCGGRFDVGALTRAVSFSCHFCGKEIAFQQ